MVKKEQNCPARARTVMVRNIAARALVRDFTIRCEDVGGKVEVKHGMFPFFIGATMESLNLKPGLVIHRGLLDASFELAVIPEKDVRVTLE